MNLVVLGLGKVGLPLASYFGQLGHRVRGFDTNTDLTGRLLAGEKPLPWENCSLSDFTTVRELKTGLQEADAVYVIVPTPLEHDRLSCRHVLEAIAEVRPQWDGPIIVGSTIESRDAERVCSDPMIGYSPPLIRLGSVVADLSTASVVLSGAWSDLMHETIQAVWKREALRGSPVTIAVAKLAINVSLSMRVAWANELDDVCKHLGADSSVVLEAVQRDPRIGRGYMTPGWSPSGPCLPRDLVVWTGLSWTPIAGVVESRHASRRTRIVSGVLAQLRELRCRRVGIAGLVYNPGALDTTLSQGVVTALSIRDMGYEVRVYDPAQYYLPDFGSGHELFDYAVTLRDLESWAEVLVVTTAWPEFAALSTDKPLIDLRR